ncbi:MAG: hypothetical protein ACOC5T_07385 [Elusimicrobiota bacterium]
MTACTLCDRKPDYRVWKVGYGQYRLYCEKHFEELSELEKKNPVKVSD